VTVVAVPEHVRRLRASVGHDLLLLPSVSVLIVDGTRLLLVRHSGLDGRWGVVGGAVEVGESPAEAAVREAGEEIGVEVQLVRLIGVLGGSDYEVTYPNGDRAAYVTAVYTARISNGTPVADGDEVSDAVWFELAELGGLPLSPLARALLTTTGYLPDLVDASADSTLTSPSPAAAGASAWSPPF
jgi:ADP-ribose pyrophosphatase YjhB (NUDIX family)